MSDQTLPEPWLRGNLTDVHPVIRAAIHALELAKEDLWKWCYPLTLEQLNRKTQDMAPLAFHLRHIARSLDRLLTYAEGAPLDEPQRAALRTESDAGLSHEELFEELSRALERSTKRLLALQKADWGAQRLVGTKRLPTTVAGLVVHVADHTQRHVGQAITTAKMVRQR